MIEVLEEALELNKEALQEAYKKNDMNKQHNLLLSISMIKDSLIDMYKDDHMYDRRNK